MRQVLAAALAAIALAGCASSHSAPDTAACKAAMTSNYKYALAHPDAPAATEPAACKGLPNATIQKLAGEIIASTGP